MSKKKTATVIRILLITVLALIMWANVHWSVALIISLLLVADELNSMYDEHTEKRLKRLEEIMHL